MNKEFKKEGFTLAEVLITLVIIGVIAAITVPTLRQGTQKQEYVAGLQKANTVLRQALYQIGINNGSAVGDYSLYSNHEFIDEFASVTNYIKKGESKADCFGDTTYKYFKGDDVPDNVFLTNKKCLITSDGMAYMAWRNGMPGGGYLSTEDNQKCLVRIYVDVNGRKKPNKFGVDTFVFFIVNGKGLVPAGTGVSDDCKSNGWGFTCGARVLKEGKMNYI